MEQIIRINVPDGKDAIYNEQTHTIEFVDKPPIRSKSWEEFCDNHSDARDEYSIGICGISGSDYTYKRCYKYHNQNLLATREDAEGMEALIKLTRLHDEWVGNWKQDYVIENPAWCIKNAVDEISIIELYSINCLLSFPSLEMADEFRSCFKDLIETAKRFI